MHGHGGGAQADAAVQRVDAGREGALQGEVPPQPQELRRHLVLPPEEERARLCQVRQRDRSVSYSHTKVCIVVILVRCLYVLP